MQKSIAFYNQKICASPDAYVWEFPLADSIVNEVLLSGYEMIFNSDTAVMYRDDEEIHYFNSVHMIEQHIYLEDGEMTNSEVIVYKLDQNGYFVIDFKLERFLYKFREPCFEKVVIYTYTYVDKFYLNPDYAPEVFIENEDNALETNYYHSISAKQVVTSNMIEVSFSEEAPNDLVAELRDLYGNPVHQDIILSRNNNIFESQNISSGVYNLIVLNHPVKSAKFVFLK